MAGVPSRRMGAVPDGYELSGTRDRRAMVGATVIVFESHCAASALVAQLVLDGRISKAYHSDAVRHSADTAQPVGPSNSSHSTR
jgi:hypothetical protein